MEIHQLRYFEAAVRLGSMMAAAAECHVSQPALSVQIRKLEEEAGARLLHREARGVRTTPAGERTLAMARRVLREASGWAGDMRTGDFESERTVRVVTQPFISSMLVSGALPGLLKTAKGGVRLRLHERAPSGIPAFLRSGEADVALADLAVVRTRGFESVRLLEMPYALFAPGRSALGRAKTAVSLAALRSEAVLLYGYAPGLEAALAEAVADPEWEPAFSGDFASTLFELVDAGAGVAVLPAVYRRSALPARVVVRPIQDYRAKVVVGMLHRSGESLPAAASELADRIRKAYPEWVA